MPRSIKIIMYSLATVTAVLIVSTWLSVSCNDQQEEKPEVDLLSIVDRSKKWTIQLGGGGQEMGDKLIITDDNNIYLLGATTGNLDGQHLVGIEYDFFLAKYNTKGEQIFLKQYGTLAADVAWGMEMDDTGNIYIAGGTEGSLDGISEAGGEDNRDIFVMKVDGQGDILWVKQIDVSGIQDTYDLVIQNNSNIYLIGKSNSYFYGEQPLGNFDILVIKMDMDGNLIWNKLFANGSFNIPRHIKIINDNQILIAWYSDGDMPGDRMSVIKNKYDSIYLMALDNQGNRLWYKKYGTNFSDEIEDMKIDQGYIYISGKTRGIFSQPDKENPNGIDILLLKLDIKGDLVWHKQYGNAGPDTASAIFIDDDYLYIAGTTNSFLPNNLSINPYDGLLVMKLTKDGDIIWSQKKLPYDASPQNPDYVYQVAAIYAGDIAVDSQKHIYVTGSTSGYLDHNKSTLSDDVFVLKYLPDGEQQ